MADDKKPEIFLAKVEGHEPRLIRTTDARLARKHVLAGIHPPAVEVRRPTTEEAMDMALDGVAVEDATTTPAPEPEPEKFNAQPDLLDPAGPEIDLNDPPRINPDDDPADHK